MSSSSKPLGLVVALALLLIAASGFVVAQNPQPGVEQDARISLQQRADCLAGGEARVSRKLGTGAVRFIGTEPGRPIHPQPFAPTPEAAARAYLAVCGALFDLQDEANELYVTATAAIGRARTAVRFQQSHRGIPIMGAELVVHLDGDQNILVVAGETLPQPSLSTVPSIDASTAIQTALEVTAKAHAVDSASLTTTPAELWIYAPDLIGPGRQQSASLVWRMNVTSLTLRPIRELVLVDALRGSVPLHFNQVESARDRNTYTADNTTTLPGVFLCGELDPGCSAGDADAAAAHVHAGDTYNYYLANFGRDSLDNAGMTLTSSVHYGAVGSPSAFWTGVQVVYGDGSPHADDVVAHELTHGVTQFTSRLFYYYQSGAINESLSDVFGEFVDLTNGRGNDTPGVRWLIGEELGAMRSMESPPLFGQPDRMTSPLYYQGPGDNGIHLNSGINNKAGYLMVDGGTFNGQTIAPLGITKVARIYYEVQTHLLTSGADYADLSDALYQGCVNLMGTAGITAADCQQVRNATLAVEMHLQPVPDFNAEAPSCSDTQEPVNVFFDDLESGGGNFVDITRPPFTPKWLIVDSYAHSGRRSLYADDAPGYFNDSSVAMANAILVPSNAYLHFAHAFAFEDGLAGDHLGWDGGVVEYSADGGTSWTDVGPLFDVNGYTGVIAGLDSNPLSMRQAFIEDSHGYISSRANLASLAGRTVRFRWRMGLDFSGFVKGWWLDDVRIYTCISSPPRMAIDAPTSGSTNPQPFVIAGWAIDQSAASGSGVDAVHVWAFPSGGGPPRMVGAASYGAERPDVAARYGPQFLNSGWSLGVTGLPPGSYTLQAHGHSAVTGTFNQLQSVPVVIGASPFMSIDEPSANALVAQPFAIGGWAVDLAAATGTGVDAVHVWGYPNPGSGAPPVFFGAATYGSSRPDVAAAFGAQFANAGYSLTVIGVPPGTYQVNVSAHSTVAGTFNNLRTVRLTIQTGPLMAVDSPAEGSDAVQPFDLAGWAIDRAAPSDTGVDTLHVWAYKDPGSGTPPIFVGVAQYGIFRSDVALVYGSRFQYSGYRLKVRDLVPGRYQFTVYAHSTVTGTFNNLAARLVDVKAEQLGPRLWIDTPHDGRTVWHEFYIAGWALDNTAASGTGIDAVHIWAYPDPGSGTAPIFLGAADYGIARTDLGEVFGERFVDSGYNLPVSGLPSGPYQISVFGHSTVTGTFNIVQSVQVTIYHP